MQKSSGSVKAKYGQIRSRLIERGLTLRQFALNRGYKPATVYNAARGERAGVVSTRIRKELEELTHV